MKDKRSEEVTAIIKSIADEITANGVTKARHEKNPAAVALGRLGGLKGGKARAEKLSAKERKEIAKRAARARWDGKEG